MKTPLSQDELLQKVSPLINAYARPYCKKTNVLAKLAKEGELVETITKDGKETANTAEPGAFLVRNQTQAGETYIMKPAVFHNKYKYLGEREDGYAEYKAVGEIEALELTDEVLQALNIEAPFYFVADWGEEMVAKQGDYLAIPSGGREVYRIARQEFHETYAPKAE